jgi:hypothetical protein
LRCSEANFEHEIQPSERSTFSIGDLSG